MFKFDVTMKSYRTMDLVSVDTVYHNTGRPDLVTYASRDWSVRAHWLTIFLQNNFGKNTPTY